MSSCEAALPEAPLDFWPETDSSDDAPCLLACCPSGIFRVSSSRGQGGQGLEDSFDVAMLDEDFETASDSPPPTATAAELVYQYKSAALCFSRCGSLLFSLHVKSTSTSTPSTSTSSSSSVAFVECTDVGRSPPACLESCVDRFDVAANTDEGTSWMVSRRASDVDQDWLLNNISSVGATDDGLVILLLGLPGPSSSCRVVTVNPSTGRKQTHANIDFKSKLDACLKIGRFRPSSFCASSAENLSQFRGCILDQDIRDVVAFDKGILVHLRSGKVWQYSTDGRATVSKVLLPTRDAMLLSVDSGILLTMTPSGAIHRLPLPFDPESNTLMQRQKKPCEREALTESQAVAEIADNLSCLEAIGAERERLEEEREQMRLAVLFGHQEKKEGGDLVCARACVRMQSTGIGGWKSAKILVEVRNMSKYDLSGKFWRLGVSLSSGGDREEGKVLQCLEVRLPSYFAAGSSPVTFFLPFGEEYCKTDSLPLEVSADLIFCVSPSSCKSSQVVVQRRAASCWLDAVDFLSLSCSLNTDLSIRGGFGGGDGDGGRRAAKTFSRSIGGATLKHIRTLLPFECLTRLSWKPSVSDLAYLLSEKAEASVSAECELFGAPVKLEAEHVEDQSCLVTLSSPDAEALFALRRSLEETKAPFLLQRNEAVKVPKRSVTAGRRIRESLLTVKGNEEEEGRALVMGCYNEARKKVSAKLP